jgi:hypothetical protein
MNLNKEFIPYEQALELKELGFDESTYAWRQHGNGISGDVEGRRDYYNRKGDVYTALPLYQQAFRWFRETYKLWSMIYPRDGWNYAIQRIDETTSCTEESFHGVEINLYEEAELACLVKLIEIVKNK